MVRSLDGPIEDSMGNIILGRRNPIGFRLLFCFSSFGRLGVLFLTQIDPNDTKIDQNDQLGLKINSMDSKIAKTEEGAEPNWGPPPQNNVPH